MKVGDTLKIRYTSNSKHEWFGAIGTMSYLDKEKNHTNVRIGFITKTKAGAKKKLKGPVTAFKRCGRMIVS